MVGDLARLSARTFANGGHGNDRPTRGRAPHFSQFPISLGRFVSSQPPTAIR